MDIQSVIESLQSSHRAEGWPVDWSENLQTAASSSTGDWSLSRRDVPTSTLTDCLPGHDLVAWVKAYARHGSAIDPVRVRCRLDGRDVHSFILHVQPEEPPDTSDKALDMVIRIAGDPQLQANIIATLTLALRPLAESLIRPVVASSIRELLQEEDEDSTTEGCQTSPERILP